MDLSELLNELEKLREQVARQTDQLKRIANALEAEKESVRSRC